MSPVGLVIREQLWRVSLSFNHQHTHLLDLLPPVHTIVTTQITTSPLQLILPNLLASTLQLPSIREVQIVMTVCLIKDMRDLDLDFKAIPEYNMNKKYVGDNQYCV